MCRMGRPSHGVYSLIQHVFIEYTPVVILSIGVAAGKPK
jgi:hypothetical protein